MVLLNYHKRLNTECSGLSTWMWPDLERKWLKHPLEKPIVILQFKNPTKPKTHQHLHHELEYASQALQETQVTTFEKQSSGLLAVKITKKHHQPTSHTKHQKLSSETFEQLAHNRKQAILIHSEHFLQWTSVLKFKNHSVGKESLKFITLNYK